MKRLVRGICRRGGPTIKYNPQPFRKNNLLEKGWAKITTDGGKSLGQNHTFFKKKCSKKYRCVSGIDLEVYFR
jgi:hypothetical protein